MRRLVGYSAIVMATLTAVVLMWQFRSVIALFLLSLAVAAAVRPLVSRLVLRGLPRPVAVTAIYLVGLVLLVAAILLAGRQLLLEVQTLTDKIAASYELAYPEWEDGSTFQQAIAGRLPPPDVLYEALTNPEGGSLFGRVLGLSRGMIGLAGGIFVVASLSVYWTIDQTRFERLWLSLLQVGHRGRAREVWRATETGVGSYLGSELIQSLIALIVLSLGYWLLGLEFPLTLAVLGAVLWLIPMVGALLTIPPVFLVGLQEGLGLAAVAVIFTLAVLWLLEYVVEPRFFDRRQYSPILTVMLMLVLIEDFGLLGLVVAPPLAAAIQSLATHLLNPARPPSIEEPEQQLAWLQERLATVRAKAVADGAANRPETDNLTDRLSGLIERTGKTMRPSTGSWESRPATRPDAGDSHDWGSGPVAPGTG